MSAEVGITRDGANDTTAMNPSRHSLLRYASFGAVLCAGTQVVFWLQLASTRPRLLFVPFFVAYSQAALLDLVIYDPPIFLRVVMWFLAYLVVALLLWLALDGRSDKVPASWTRVIASWLLTVATLTTVARVLLDRGIIQME